MPGVQERSEVILGGMSLLLYEERGVPLSQTVHEEQSNDKPRGYFTDVVTFGSWGIGATLPVVRNECHWMLGLDTEDFDVIQPGLQANSLGAAWNAQPVVLRAMSDLASEQSKTGTALTVSDDATHGTIAWTNVNNARTSDNSYATATLNAGETTHDILVRFQNFTDIPSTGNVVGIKVQVEGKWDGLGGVNPQLTVWLGNTTYGATVNKSTTFNSTVDAVYTLGGVNDLWSFTHMPDIRWLNGAGGGLFGTSTDMYAWINVGVGAAAVATTMSIDAITLTLYYTPANKYLYAAEGPKLHKIRLNAITASASAAYTEITGSAVTFSHGDNYEIPTITDLCVLKESAGGSSTDAGGGRGGGTSTTTPPDCRAIVGFGPLAQIQQIDTVGFNTTADTYHALGGGKVYGGRFAIALGRDNTKALVWSSTGYAAGATTDGSSGAFCRVQAAEIINTTTDMTAAATWSPTTPYLVGEFGTDVTDMAEWQQGLHVGKPEAVYAFNENYAGRSIFGMRSYRNAFNARGMLAWGESLLIPTSQDLMALPASDDATIGLTTLLSQRTVTGAVPTALAHWGKYLFAAYYDGTDSYIFRTRRAVRANVPHPLLWWPIVKVTAHRVRCLFVTDNGQPSPVYTLWWDQPSGTAGKYDLGYMVLAPAASRESATGGTWESTLVGSMDVKLRLEKLAFHGESLDANNYYTVAISWDGAAYQTLGTISGTGRQLFTFTSNVNDTGYRFRLRLTCTRASTSTWPKLLASGKASGDSEGGIVVEGIRIPDDQDTLEMKFLAADDGQIGIGGSLQKEAGDEIYTALVALKGTVTTLQSERHFGNRTGVSVTVENVAWSWGMADSPSPPQRIITVRLRRTAGA